jgi:hypothetical protein
MTPRAPYTTRRWSQSEDKKFRALVAEGMNVRTIGRELNRSFLAIQARAKKLDLVLAPQRDHGRHLTSAPNNRGGLWSWG